MWKNNISWSLFIVILASLSFFRPAAFSEVFLKLLHHVIMVIMMIVVFRKNTYIEKRNNPFYKIYCLVFLEVGFSMINSQQFQGQDIITSCITDIRFLAYGVYFYLCCKNYATNKVVDTMNFTSLIFTVAFIIAFMMYPQIIFAGYGIGDEVDTARGFQRIRLTLMGGAPIYFTFFYGIYHIKKNLSSKWIILTIVSFIIIVMQLGRMSILLSAILGLLYYLDGIKLYKKVIICVVAFVLTTDYASQIPVIGDLIELSQNQQESTEDNIRLLSFEYYSTEINTNPITMALGSGMYSLGNSKYGDMVNAARDMGLIPADVGWVFIYMCFGFAGILLYLALLFYGLKMRVPDEIKFVKYYMLFLYLSSITGNTLLGCIPFVCICTYLLYRGNKDLKLSEA